jgi:hypothetical protein
VSIVRGIVVAVLVAAGLDLAQVLLARRFHVLNMAAYFGGTGVGDWNFQVTLVIWFAVAAALYGAVAGRLVTGPDLSRRAGLALAACAATATLVSAPIVLRDAARAVGGLGPAGLVPYVRPAVVAGVVIGALAAAVVTLSAGTAVPRGLACWVGWMWLAGGLSAWWWYGDAYYGTDVYPLGSIRYPRYTFGVPSTSNDWHFAIDATAVVLICGVLAWWAVRRTDRWPVLGGVSGPLLAIVVYLASRPDQNEEYQGGSDVVRWIVLALFGTLAAATAAWLTRRVPSGRAAAGSQ